jgi:hypothetical protein
MFTTSNTPKNVIVKNETKVIIVKPVDNEIKMLPKGNYVFNLASSNDVFYLSAENLPLNSPVILNAQGQLEVAKASNPNHSDSFLGLNLFSTPINLTATIRNYGLVSNDNWNWELNKPIFLGINGDLTQTIDNGISFLLHIAKPITDKSIFILQNNPIIL